MFEDYVEYFWEYNMTTSGTSTTERCVTGMSQNDYLLQKMMRVCIELRLPQNELIGINPFRIVHIYI